jgi:hypothetical protein
MQLELSMLPDRLCSARWESQVLLSCSSSSQAYLACTLLKQFAQGVGVLLAKAHTGIFDRFTAGLLPIAFPSACTATALPSALQQTLLHF